jgi:hypothetical protein
MGELVKVTRNIFIDSTTNTNIDNTEVSVNLIPQDFSCGQDEEIRLELETFEMRNNFYNVNINNNIFYIYNPTSGLYYSITIQQGSYADFLDTVYNPGVASPTTVNGIATAIQTALNTAVVAGAYPPFTTYGASPSIGTGHTCSYDPITRDYTIVINFGGAGSNGTLDALSYPVCFCVPNGQNLTDPPPANVNQFGYFSDSYEILGGRANKQYKAGIPPLAFNNVSNPANSSTNAPNSSTATSTTWVSPYVAQLNTNEALYLRTNLQSSNYSTYGFAQSIYQNAITPSNIFARIPLQNQIYNISDPFIVFENKNDPFIIDIGNKQLNQFTLFLTDDKNRFIPLTNYSQVIGGMLSFKLTIKFEILVRDQANPFIPSVQNLTTKFKGLPHQP